MAAIELYHLESDTHWQRHVKDLLTSLDPDVVISHFSDMAELTMGCQAQTPDVVVCDISCESTHLFDALGFIREQGEIIPFIFLGEAIGQEAVVQAYDQGADDFILKKSPGRLPASLKRAMRLANSNREFERNAEAIKDVQKRLQYALNGTRDGLWDWELATKSAWFSSKVGELLGYDTYEFEGTYDAFVACVHPKDRPSLLKAIDAHLYLKQALDKECRFRLKDGSEKWFRLCGGAVRNDDGDAIRLSGSMQDIDARKSMEGQMAQLQKLESLGRLAGGLAHDINNMCLVVNGHCNLIKRRIDTTDPMQESLGEILEATDRTHLIIEQLLAFSKNQALEVETFDVNGEVQDLTKMLTRLIGEDLELIIHSEDEWLGVEMDRGQFQQIVMNLAVNARDAMESGGNVTVTTRRVELPKDKPGPMEITGGGSFVELRFSDEGCGMSEEVLAKIFDPYFSTKEDKGTGLGLSTLHGIVTSLGGYVWVWSQERIGTMFHIYLPLAKKPVDTPSAVTEDLMMEEGALPPATILLVEDEATVRAATRDILELEGLTVIEASNPYDALDIYRERHDRIDMILSDIVMPKMSGLLMLDQVFLEYGPVPTLTMSGHVNQDIAIEEIEAKYGFIQKPYNINELLQRIRDKLVA